MAATRRNGHYRFDRRAFLANTSALGAASLLALPRTAAAEPPPEVKTIRLIDAAAICLAPQYLAQEMLRLEGFTDVQYVTATTGTISDMVWANQADLTMEAAPALFGALDQGKPLVVIGGVHAGCYELMGNDKVHAIRDLKGKSIAIYGFGAADHVMVSSMLAYVGMDPRKDVEWVVGHTFQDTMRLFVEGKVDAFMGFAPQPQELRLKKIGHVIVSTTLDRPWSQYFCCMIAANRDFARTNPVATKRALRAYLKAADICIQDPDRAARLLVERGHEPRYDIALQVIKELPYRRWRDAHPEDTLRFHALRLHEVGMIKTTPQKLIAQGTDWRYLNEVKTELKA